MGFWAKLFGRKQNCADAAEVAGRIGELIRRLDAGTQDAGASSNVGRLDWRREVGNIKENMVAAVNALLTGRDPDGKPISTVHVGVGLGRMCLATLGDPQWAGPFGIAMGRDAWSEVGGVLKEVQAIGRQLEEGRVAAHVSGRPVRTNPDGKENIARAIETGKDPNGRQSTREDEVQALAGVAMMLEKDGKQAVAVELVFVIKDLQGLAST